MRSFGTDALTLARVADRAGVTKPVVYDHFVDRSGLLSEIYRNFEDQRRTALITTLAVAPQDLDTVADLIAEAYISCWVAEGRELADVIAALRGSPTLNELREEAEQEYIAMCQRALRPLCGAVTPSRLSAVIGAGDTLARNVMTGSMTEYEARATLAVVLRAVVGAGQRAHDPEPFDRQV